MSASSENYYYEIALTNRQVLVAFVVLLFCVLGAFVMGVWVGRAGQGQALAAEVPPPAEASSEIADLDSLEEFRFGSSTGGEELEKPDLSGLRAEPAPAGAAGHPAARRQPQADDPASGAPAGPRSGDTTLVQDVDRAAAGGAPADPPSRRRAEPRREQPAVQPAAPPPSSPPAPTTSASPAPAATEGFVVQVFSTREESQAEKVLKRLQEGGYRRAFLSPVQVGNQTMYRVRVGPFAERAPAEKVARTITTDYKLETWITAASN